MGKKILWVVVSCLMALSLVIASCGPKEEVEKEEPAKEEPAKEEPAKEEPAKEEPLQKEVVPGKEVPWWDRVFGEPKYGGTINLRRGGDYTQFDPWYISAGQFGPEEMFTGSYAFAWEDLDAQKAMGGSGVSISWLGESREQVDPLTWRLHLRKGVRWWNKPPVNGREFVAEDVVYHYDRLLGWGHGFTSKSPWAITSTILQLVESIKVIDKYTVEWKFKTESLTNESLVGGGVMVNRFCCPKEAIDLWGDVNDWKRTIATGAYMMTDYVTSSIITYKKNPDYYGVDERHPENKLPYADELRELIIPDLSTTMAAIRTGKVDVYLTLGWQEALALKKTNPDIQQFLKVDNGGGVSMRCDTKPFNDIRVRKALQLVINLEELAQTLYGGLVKATPSGKLAPYQIAQGSGVPYEEWPQELKDEYTYNPKKAKELLAEAGYPNGFKTNCMASTASNLDQLLIIKAWLLEIGVDMEIKTLDGVTYSSMLNTHKYDQMNATAMTGCNITPPEGFGRSYSKHSQNFTQNKDAVFDQMYEAAQLAVNAEERNRLWRECDLYDLAHHWQINTLPVPSYSICQAWLKGYIGEYIHPLFPGFFPYRLWIDTDLKKSLGY